MIPDAGYQIPLTITLERGMRMVIFWGPGEEARGTFLHITASQRAPFSCIHFHDEETHETDSIPLSYVHHIEKVGE